MAGGTQLDDEFAESLYPDCGGLDKLRGIMEAAEMRMLDSQTKQKVRCGSLLQHFGLCALLCCSSECCKLATSRRGCPHSACCYA